MQRIRGLSRRNRDSYQTRPLLPYWRALQMHSRPWVLRCERSAWSNCGDALGRQHVHLPRMSQASAIHRFAFHICRSRLTAHHARLRAFALPQRERFQSSPLCTRSEMQSTWLKYDAAKVRCKVAPRSQSRIYALGIRLSSTRRHNSIHCCRGHPRVQQPSRTDA